MAQRKKRLAPTPRRPRPLPAVPERRSDAPPPPQQAEAERSGTDLDDDAIRKMLEAAYT
jgi:hypothetical protein